MFISITDLHDYISTGICISFDFYLYKASVENNLDIAQEFH